MCGREEKAEGERGGAAPRPGVGLATQTQRPQRTRTQAQPSPPHGVIAWGTGKNVYGAGPGLQVEKINEAWSLDVLTVVGRRGSARSAQSQTQTSGPRVAPRDARARPSQAVVTVMFRLRRGSGIRYCSFRRRVPVSPGTTWEGRAGQHMKGIIWGCKLILDSD